MYLEALFLGVKHGVVGRNALYSTLCCVPCAKSDEIHFRWAVLPRIQSKSSDEKPAGNARPSSRYYWDHCERRVDFQIGLHKLYHSATAGNACPLHTKLDNTYVLERRDCGSSCERSQPPSAKRSQKIAGKLCKMRTAGENLARFALWKSGAITVRGVDGQGVAGRCWSKFQQGCTLARTAI